MLSALLQTIANLGFYASAITDAFNAVLGTISQGDVSTLGGLGGIFSGIISVFTGIDASDVSAVITTLVESVTQMLSGSLYDTFLAVFGG